jgi:hypothetical protein
MVDEIRAIFQNTVVDIQPTSRYGDDADTAFVTSTILLEAARAATDYADHGEVTTALDGRMIQIRTTVRIPGSEDTYTFSFSSPTGPSPLMKNGDYSLVVLLPRAGIHPVGPIFEVELLRYSKENNARVFGTDALPQLGSRIAVGWSARRDPEDTIDYIYRTITG